jgi:hypothetical protein
MVMVAYSQEAQSHLERYLRQVKTALRGHPSIDADEVERDVLGHIDAELSGQPEPIAASRLLQVLDRLGTPNQWVPVDDPPGWRHTFDAFSSGPGDWRLASLTFGLFVAGPSLFMGAMTLWPLPPVLMVLSFLMARVTLALFDERGEQVGVRRWLIYPALMVWYGVFAVALFGGPALLIGVFGSDDPAFRTWLVGWLGEPAWLRIPSLILLLLGTWWTLLGIALGRITGIVHAVFWPFADWFEARHARRVALTGMFLVAISGTILVLLIWIGATQQGPS